MSDSDFNYVENSLRKRIEELEAQVIRLQMQLGKTDYIDSCMNPVRGFPVRIGDKERVRNPKEQIKYEIYEGLVLDGRMVKARKWSQFWGKHTEYNLPAA